MDPRELVKFLKTLSNYVPAYWKRRINEVIVRMGGTP